MNELQTLDEATLYMFKKYDRVKFDYIAGGVKKVQLATIAKEPYFDPLVEEVVVDLDCDGWQKRLVSTPILGLELA